MAVSIDIKSVRLNLADALDNFQDFPAMSELKTLDEKDGKIRVYAGGRRRSVTTPGISRSFQLTLPICTRVQIDWLKANVARGVLVRDNRGNKIYCVYYKVPVVEFSGDIDEGDVTLELFEYTHPEAV